MRRTAYVQIERGELPKRAGVVGIVGEAELQRIAGCAQVPQA